MRVDREHVIGLLGQDEFSISLRMQGNTPGDHGEVMRLNGSFIVSVDRNNELYVRTFSEDGSQTRLTTNGANLGDGAFHNIEIGYNNGTLSIEVDGENLASAAMPSPLRGADGHDLVFGNPWNNDNFENTITAFDITVNASDFSQRQPDDPVTEVLPVIEDPQPEEPDSAPVDEVHVPSPGGTGILQSEQIEFLTHVGGAPDVPASVLTPRFDLESEGVTASGQNGITSLNTTVTGLEGESEAGFAPESNAPTNRSRSQEDQDTFESTMMYNTGDNPFG